jgi:putative ABC transport system permease protein
MRPRWMKLVRDTRATQGRLLTMVAALAAGIAGVVTMLSTYTVLTREVTDNYLRSKPASATLILDAPLSDATLQRVRSVRNVAAASLYSAVSSRIQRGRNEWFPMLLFVVPAFAHERIAVVIPESGAHPFTPRALLIERSALELSKHAVDDTVIIEGQGERQIPIRIGATVHDPGVAPAWQEQTVYAYVEQSTLSAAGWTPPLTRLKLEVTDGNRDPIAIAATARDVATVVQQSGVRVDEIRVPPPGKHPHQSQMNAVMEMLLIFSVLALVLSAVLTGTIMNGLLAQQISQIAIMKTVGARSAQIAQMYLTLVLTIATLALGLGLPLGIAGGRVFISLVAQLLNLTISSRALPAWLIAGTVGAGLLLPLAAASIPIRSAARRTIRSALDFSGATLTTTGRGGWLRRVTSASAAPAAIRLAARNTVRRRGRFALTAALLAGAGAMFITSLNLLAAWRSTVRDSAAARHYQFELYLDHDASIDSVQHVLTALRAVRTVEPWASAHASIPTADAIALTRSYPDGAHGGFSLRAAPPRTSLFTHEMLSGRWLTTSDTLGVVLNSLAHRTTFAGARVGDWIAIRSEDRVLNVQLIGIVRELLTAGAAYVVPARFEAVTQSQGQSRVYRIALTVPRATQEGVSAVTSALTTAGLKVGGAVTEARLSAAQGGHVYILVFALGFIASIMVVVGLLGLSSSLGVSVTERTREFGIMRAIGAPAATIRWMVVAEAVCTALVSWVVAIVAASPLSRIVGRVLDSTGNQELQVHLSAGGVSLWLAVLMIGAVSVSLWPAIHASRLLIRQSLSFT